MQAFGLELRRFGNAKSLYDEVDKVLAKTISEGVVSKEIQKATVAHALQEMFRMEKHFSVCAVKECSNICQVHIPKERMEVYQAIHCISWSSMLPEYRNAIIAMVLDDFRPVLGVA